MPKGITSSIATPPATSIDEDKAVRLTWVEEAPAPEPFTSLTGTAVAEGNTAYFSCDHEIYSFAEPDYKWILLPWCKYKSFGMAVINGKLTTIGGCEDSSGMETNVLTSLVSKVFTGKDWKETLPPMLTKRTLPAAVTTNTYLVVAGGLESACKVEVLNMKTLHWSTACSLPELAYYPQMVLCQEQLYISLHESVLSCSLEKLLKSCETTPAQDSEVWTRLSHTNQYSVSLVTLGDCLLALGGSDNLSTTPKADILCYDEKDNNWGTVTRQIPSPRFRILTAVLEGHQVMVVGGKNTCNPKTKDTYIGLSE